MAFHVRDPETDRLARELARMSGTGLTAAVRTALRNEIERQGTKIPLVDRIRDLQDILASAGRTGLKADKAFFDEMWGEEDVR